MEYDYAQRIYYQHLAEINRAIALPLPGVTGVSERVVLLRRVDANGAIMAIKIPEDNATFIKNIKTLASEDYKALTQKGEIWKGFADESYR